jgi:perosamine synthetase
MNGASNLDSLRAEADFFNKFLGSSQSLAQALEPSISRPSSRETIGWITPVTRADLWKSGLISDFSMWRGENQCDDSTRFNVSEEGTKRWLDSVLSSSSRLLFTLTDSDNKRVGHLGLSWNFETDQLEVDSVLRGEKVKSGFMTKAMEWLEDYSYKEFNTQSLSLRVLESNSRAVSFYKRLGYEVDSVLNLSSVSEGEFTTLVRDESGTSDKFLTMKKDLENTRIVPEEVLTAGPSIGFREMAYVADAVLNGWNSRHATYLSSFQDQFSEFIGSTFSLATSSCTGALHLALAAVGAASGDEVIVPAITWVATASAVRYTGATPIFADVNKISWTLDPDEVRRLITPKTKAIVAVHLYGFVADVSALRKLADEFGIFLIEDAAPAIGATLNGRAAGTFGHFGCYSFQGAKLLVTGEGGMLVTDSSELFNRAVKLQEHGRRPGTFWIDEVGYKYKMSNLTAALGLGQLERAGSQIEKKRRIYDWYRSSVGTDAPVSFQEGLSGTIGIAWMTSILIDEGSGFKRDGLMAFLKQNGVDSRPTFPSLVDFEFWGTDQPELPVSRHVGASGINLPSGVGLSRPTVNRIGELVKKFTS